MIEQISVGGYDNNFSYFVGDDKKSVAEFKKASE